MTKAENTTIARLLKLLAEGPTPACEMPQAYRRFLRPLELEKKIKYTTDGWVLA